jgi:PAS domain S-box-containing protein
VAAPPGPEHRDPADPPTGDGPGGLLEALGPSALWALLFRDAPVAYALLDLAGNEQLANAAYTDLFGRSEAELAEHPIVELTHPDDRDQARRTFARLASGALDSAQLRSRYQRPDGSLFWGLLTARPLRGTDGEPVALLGSIVDVTAEVDALDALAASERRLRSLLSHTGPIVVLDREATITYVSPPAEALVQIQAADLLGRSVLDLVHPDDSGGVAAAFLDALRDGGTERPLRLRAVRADDTAVPIEVEATAVFDDPAIGGMVVTITDLTDREDPDVVSVLSERRFRTLLLNTSDMVTLIDADGHVIDTLGTEVDTLGRVGEEVWLGRNLIDLIHPDDAPRAAGRMMEVLAIPGSTVTDEFRALHADGTWQTIRGTAVNRLDDPDVRAVVLTTHNVTEEREAEAALEQARDEAVRTLVQRAQFVANVSHELRTPIHGILGLTELLAAADMDDASKEMVGAVHRAAGTLQALLDELLDFSKIEAGRLELSEGPVPFGELVAEVVNLFEPKARSKGLEVDLRSSPSLPELIWGDGLRLRQIISNLVGNAVKFTDAGSVSVSVECERRGLDAVDVRVTVADTGIGISEDELGRLFEPFGQAHASTAQRYGGTGLGLSIARRLAEAMGGTLTVSSRPGAGSSFRVALPARSVATVRATDTSGAAAGGVPAVATVLVVEDNPVSQMLVARQLERLGHEVVITGSGEEAVEVFGALRPAAVLMDWQLPGFDGLEATRRIRALEGAGERVPVIAMTASALSGDRERCLEAGMDDVLTKPVSMATLGATLRQWLAPAAPADAVPEQEGTGPDAGAPAPLGPDAGFDLAAFGQLAEEVGDDDLLATVVGAYLRELPTRVQGIEAAVAADDRGELGRIAHTLGSTSAAMGAASLSGACRRIEALCAADEGPVGLPDDWEALHSGAARTLEALLAREG